jgi:hypothetical protein
VRRIPLVERGDSLFLRSTGEDDFFFVFHDMAPPTGKTLRELGLER